MPKTWLIITNISVTDAKDFRDSQLSFSFLLLFKTKSSLSAQLENNILLKNATYRALTKVATISNHSEKNLTHMCPLLKSGHESIHLEQSAQSIYKMSQNILCLITLPSGFSLLPFPPISSSIYPFLKPGSQIKPSLTSFNVSVYYLAAPLAFVHSA